MKQEKFGLKPVPLVLPPVLNTRRRKLTQASERRPEFTVVSARSVSALKDQSVTYQKPSIQHRSFMLRTQQRIWSQKTSQKHYILVQLGHGYPSCTLCQGQYKG